MTDRLDIRTFNNGSENGGNSTDGSSSSLWPNLRERFGGLLRNLDVVRAYRDSPLKILNREQEEVIHILIFLQEKFQSPSKEDFRRVTVFSSGTRRRDWMKRIQHLTEVTLLTVKLIADFAMGVPGFSTLTKVDQFTLLKGGCMEAMLLRLARKYDQETNSTVFGDSRHYTRGDFFVADMGHLANFIFDFCDDMCQRNVKNGEYALLTAFIIFSQRHSFLEPEKVKKLQGFYLKALKAYIDSSRGYANDIYAWLVLKLDYLQKHCNANFKQWLSVTVYENYLPPLIEEMVGTQE